jgi:hypothetical protein
VLAAAIGLLFAPPTELFPASPTGPFAATLAAIVALATRPRGALIEKHLTLGAMFVAVLAGPPLATAAALAFAAAAALTPHAGAAWHRIPVAGAGLGLVLFGALPPPAPLPSVCALFGLAALAVATPELLPVLPFLALRTAAPQLPALGAAATLGCGVAAVLWPVRKPRNPWIPLTGAAAIALGFGLRTPDAILAGLVLAVLLALSQASRALATGQGVTTLLAAAGLAGLPPLGVFPGLAMVAAAVARQSPWLLAAFLPGVALSGWAAIRRLPPPRPSAGDRWSAAWIPLAAALLIGWLLPDPVAAWLRDLARAVSG